MISSKTINDTRDGALVNAKAPSYRCIRLGLGQKNDLGDVTVAEFPVANRHDASLYGVGVVSEARNPFEVIDAVIGFDRVDMIDLWQVVWVRNERQSDKTVDWSVSYVLNVAKINGNVAPVAKVWFENLSFAQTDSSTTPSSETIQTSHSSESTDLVEVGEPVNGDGSPFLDHLADFHDEISASSNTAPFCRQSIGG